MSETTPDTEPEATEPSIAERVASYVGDGWEADEVTSAYRAERAAQSRRCRVPAEDAAWPDDLAEALCRRVAHNLALRNKPLGLESSVSEVGVGFARVGGLDAEVRRLEAPHRKAVLG